EQTVFQGQIGDNLLERGRLTPQVLDLVRSCGTSRVTGQALLASLQEVLRPAIVQVLRDTLAAAQLGDAVLAAQAFQNDPDLFLRRILLACRPADVLDDLLGMHRKPLRAKPKLKRRWRSRHAPTAPSVAQGTAFTRTMHTRVILVENSEATIPRPK